MTADALVRPDFPFFMLEDALGRWLANGETGEMTRDAFAALRYISHRQADCHRRNLPHPLWCLSVTEHAWCVAPSRVPAEWDEDGIAAAIQDSIDMDWTARDGARAVVRYLMGFRREEQLPCSVCGCEERSGAGYLLCECPAPLAAGT